jgi:hypothetical protein
MHAFTMGHYQHLSFHTVRLIFTGVIIGLLGLRSLNKNWSLPPQMNLERLQYRIRFNISSIWRQKKTSGQWVNQFVQAIYRVGLHQSNSRLKESNKFSKRHS